jgi:hypothetical protein
LWVLDHQDQVCHHLGTLSHVWHVPVKVWCVQLYYRYTGRSCIGFTAWVLQVVVFQFQGHRYPGQVPGSTRCPVKLRSDFRLSP